MIEKKYVLNNEFDGKLFFYIIKKNIIFLLVFLLVVVLSTFLYLRYTQPIYEAFSIIQIKSDDIASRVLDNQDKTYLDNSLSKKLEVLRSPMFLRKVVAKLPLDVQIFSVGEIGQYEQYTYAPFVVEYQILDSNYFARQFYLTFKENTISVQEKKTGTTKEIHVGEPAVFQGIIFSIHPRESVTQTTFTKKYDGKKFLIKFYLLDELASLYANKISIQILNDAAKTIKILVQETNPKKAYDIVQQIVNQFEQFDLESQRESHQNILNFIEEQLIKLDSSLNALTDESISSIDKPKDEETIKLNIETTKEEISRLQKEITTLNKLIQNVQNEEDEVNMYGLIVGSESFSLLAPYVNTLQMLEIKKREELQKVTPESPFALQLNQQIEFQKKIIKKIAEELKKKYTNELDEKKSKILAWETLLLKDKESRKPAFVKKQKLQNINEEIFNQLIQKKVEYSIALAGYISQINVLQPPQIIPTPVKPQKKAMWFASILLFVVISLLYLGLRYLFYNKIVNPSDVRQLSSTPIIGVIPQYLDYLPVSQLIVENKPHSIIAEAFRSIRSQIQVISKNEKPKVITVTSTVAGEGKTFVAMNLASIFALGKSKVILLDLDLRRPKIHLGLNTENLEGVSSILLGKATIEECIHQSNIPNLHYITAGKPMLFPAELIMSQAMDAFLNQLKQQYDYIVIDTPPVGLTSETLKPVLMADFALYVVRANFSNKSFLLNVNKLKEDNGLQNLYIIVNSINPKISSAAKYDGYIYGYAYGYGYNKHPYYHDEQKLTSWYQRIFKKR